MVIDRVFDFVYQVVGKRKTFGFGAIGRRSLAEAVADSKDMLSGGFEVFVDNNAGGFIFDFGVFKTIIEGRLTAGGENDTIDTDHFFVFAVFKDNAFRKFIFFECDDFGAS